MTSILSRSNFGIAHKVTAPVGSVSESLSIRTKADGEPITDVPYIITYYKIVTADNVQFMPTVGEDLYTYVLGTTPYTLTISGQLYNDCCDSGTTKGQCVKKTLDKYEELKASKNKKPLIVAIGDTTFTALLQEIAITASNESKTEIFNFVMVLKGIINKK